MRIPLRSNHSASRQVYQDKFDEREAWHKLVVKVICWKDGSAGNGRSGNEKITPKEWNTYCQRMLKTNLSMGREKVTQNLKDLEKAIKTHKGFA